jgi:multisubunit Na+/H+ antiporter MnhB subunit
MRRTPDGFNPRQFARSTEGRLVLGFFVLLYVVGGGLIWFFYGPGGALLGMLCMTGGLLLFLLLYAIVWLLGRWAGD